MPQPLKAEEAKVERFYDDLHDLLKPNTKKRCPLHTEDWNAKVGGKEIPGVIGKFGLGVQSEAGQS